MKKLTFFLVLMFAGSAITRAQINVVEGSYNFYEDLYGTTISNSIRGASDALFYITGAQQDVFAIPALVNQGFNVTVAANYDDFNTKLATGNYALAVVFNQGGCCYLGLSLATVQNFISGGGCMIFCDWELTQSFANLFGASFTGGTNATPATIIDPLLANGIANPVALTNPDYGWGTWSTSMTPIGSGEVLATFPDGSAAVIRGNNYHTILLGYLADTPPAADRQQLLENVIKSTTCGGYHDLPVVPVSNWALFVGIGLILVFAVVRFRKMV